MLEKIEFWLVKRGMTQSALEQAADLAENRISKLKNYPVPNLRAKEVLRIARKLNVPVEYLIDDEMEVPPAQEVLSEAESRAVEMVCALDLDVQDVIRGLTYAATEKEKRARIAADAAPPPPRGRVGHEADPGTGLPLKRGPKRPGYGEGATG